MKRTKLFCCTAAYLFFLISCNTGTRSKGNSINPFFAELNRPIDYKAVTPANVKEYAQATINNVEKTCDTIKNEKEINLENTYLKFDRTYGKLKTASQRCYMLFMVAEDSVMRNTGKENYETLYSLEINLFSDSVLYYQLKMFFNSVGYAHLTENKKYFIENILQRFEQGGANLTVDKKKRFKALDAEIVKLSGRFSKNLAEFKDSLILNNKQIKGIPANFSTEYKRNDSVFIFPIDETTKETVLVNAEDEETRRSYYFKYCNRASVQNLAILDTLSGKRHELASLLGHRSYAAYLLKPKMAKSPEIVWNFLKDLVIKTNPKTREEYELLKQYRNTVLKSQSNDEPVEPWNLAYYRNQVIKSKFDVDNEKVKEYFTMQRCLDGMFKTYQQLLGFEFREVDHPSVWNKDVKLYEVYEDNKLKGFFYLDLYERPGKYSWFSDIVISWPHLTEKGTQLPVSLLVCNFPKPTETTPSLLSMLSLQRLFHEFGHAMNDMAYDGNFASQVWAQDDFGEAMSQIFENWIWNYDILSKLSKHYKTGETLPKEIFDKMLRAKNITSGLDTQEQLRRALYDMELYDNYMNTGQTDLIWKKIDKQLLIPRFKEGTHPQGSWTHIYTHPNYFYGYLWSNVYAQDMFTVFQKNGLTDRATGIKYKQLILTNGAQRDNVDAVTKFLGRPPNSEAYLKSLGLN